MKPWTIALLLPLALAGCGKGKDDDRKATASGQLLPRSVSDDMLPYDTVRSQPTLANPDAVVPGGDDARPTAKPQATPEAEGDATEAPPEAPSPSPSPT